MRNRDAHHCFFDDDRALALLRKHAKGQRVIGFPLVRSCFSWKFKLNREQTERALEEMREKGIIEIIGFHGVRILAPKGETQ